MFNIYAALNFAISTHDNLKKITYIVTGTNAQHTLSIVKL